MTHPHSTVKLHNLTIGYHASHGHNVVVATDLCAELRAGEFTCLLGPNGAGKSTLLKTLSAFQKPLSGSISVNGRSLANLTAVETAKTIGMVLTQRITVANMTVSEVVGMGRAPYTGFFGTLSAHDKEMVAKAMEMVGITELSGRRVLSLSDGERQKAMIAKALAQDTPVIYLDEPTAFLDFPSKREVMRLLRELAHERGTVIFMSTHDVEVALQLADRVWLLDKAQGLTTGTPRSLAHDGSIGRYFDRGGSTFDASSMTFRIG